MKTRKKEILDNILKNKGSQMEFTGERFVPGHPELTNLFQEHIIRYMFSSQFVKSKTVLDAGCGTGYGSYILAQKGAKKVVGIDNSNEAIDYCNKNYKGKNLEFNVEDCTKLNFSDSSFDVVVAFELIEHLEKPNSFLSEVKGVLKKNGTFILSTPNKLTYTIANPFHYKEFTEGEFRQTLEKKFSNVSIFYQSYPSALAIYQPGSDKGIQELNIHGKDSQQDKSALYLVAVCSNKKPTTISNKLFLFDKPTIMLRNYPIIQKNLNKLQDESLEKDVTLVKLRKDFEERTEWAKKLDKNLKQKTQDVSKLQKEYDKRSEWTLSLDKKLKQKTQDLANLQKESDKRSEWALSLDKKLKQKTQDLAKLQDEYDKRSEWTISLDKELKQKTQDVSKLQKEFSKRTEWAKKLDKKLEQKTQDVSKLQKEYDKRNELAISLEKELKQKTEDLKQKMEDLQNEKEKLHSKLNDNESEIKNLKNIFQTKDSQIQNIQSELDSTQRELDLIRNSAMFGISSGIARSLDKIAPKSTRRGSALKIVADAYITRKKHGTKTVLKATKSKISKKKQNTEHSKLIPSIYIQTKKGKKTQQSSNIIKIEEKFENDSSLRHNLRFGSHNITNLPSFPKISIIIITLDQVEALKRNLASIEEKSTYKNYEIIIVTNNHDETSEMRKFLKNVKHTVCTYDDPYSFGGMNNVGASKAKGEFLLFLNDDVEIKTPNWLEAFLSLGLKKSTGVVGAKLLLSDGKLQDCGGIVWKNGNAWNYGRNYDPDDPKFNYVRDIDYCSGSCLFVKADLFNKVGGFDSKFDPAYWEDTDLCFSIHKLGYHILYQPLAKLVHYEGMTQGTTTDKGLKSFQLVNQKKFQEKWKSELDNHLDDSTENALLECNRKAGLNILYIDHYVPEPDQDSGSLRTFRILGILASMGNKITFWPDNLNFTKPYVQELQQKGIEIIYGSNDFSKFLDERKHVYDVVVMARPYISRNYIDLIKSKMPNCKIIYDTIDLHFLRMMRGESIENKSNTQEIEEMRELELSLMKKSDVTILTSTAEAEILHKEDDSLKFSILPNIHIETESIDKFENRKNLIFLGGFQHIPNIDSAEFLVKEIWPLIKQKISDAKLYIVGSRPPANIKSLASGDVIVTGFVKDLTSYYQECKVMLAPLRYGAGVKGKITQSLAMGLPVVTTTTGAEGIDLIDSKNCMIADKPEDFAKKTIQVYTEKELWNKLSLNGLEVAKEYSPEKIRACLKATIYSILKRD